MFLISEKDKLSLERIACCHTKAAEAFQKSSEALNLAARDNYAAAGATWQKLAQLETKDLTWKASEDPELAAFVNKINGVISSEQP